MEGNVFAGSDIHLPDQYQEYFHRYCLTRTEGSRNKPEDSPFPRMVDMWFLAMCMAIKLGKKPIEVEGKTYKAIEGVVFGSDPWRANILMLVAVAHTGKVDVTSSANEMLRIANGYALAGLPDLIAMLEQKGGDTALDHISSEIENLLTKSKPAQKN